MLQTIMQAMKIPDLKKRIGYVFMMFAVYVVGLHIPVPGINREAMAKLFAEGSIFNLMDAFTGGAFKKYTIFAMGIAPYINASIIMQLLTIAVPSLEQLAKEGESGRKVISQYTRYLTVIMAVFQAFGMNTFLRRMNVLDTTYFGFVQIMLTLTAGTAFLMWVGEQITDKGIGNGVSLVIFCGIMASMPVQVTNTFLSLRAGAINWMNVILLLLFFVATVMAIVAVNQAQRRIPVQHVKRVVGHKVYGGQSSYLPLRVNSAGVIPIIFAVSIQLLPSTLANFGGSGPLGKFLNEMSRQLSPGQTWYAAVLYAAFIVFFTYFYTAVTFNVPEVADNLKKWGSFIPGIRPGKPTMEYLDRVMTRITLAGAFFLAFIALAQYYIPKITGVTTFGLVGGTSLLIVVGVALETMQAIEAHLLMRHYEGFIK